LFAVKVTKNPKRDSYRLAVVVSKKVDKSAVARNKMRRRLYEAFREIDSQIKEPADIVLTVYNSDVIDEPWQKLIKQLKKQLKEAGIFKA
jgi:ribonuclease P protein component